MKYAAQLEKVSVRRENVPILIDITLDIPEGKVVGLLGPSGAGKTTLMRALVGLQRPTSGQVLVLGLPAGTSRLRPRVGYVTQTPSVYSDLSVEENLHYFGAMLDADRQRVKRIMRDVRLEDHAGQLVGRLSGGQRARVSLAIALLGHPELLVLDEPTVGLDPVLRKELWEQFHRLAQSGVALVVSSHVMDEARRCDSLILLREGRVLATGSPRTLMTRTGTADVESAFLKLVEAPA